MAFKRASHFGYFGDPFESLFNLHDDVDRIYNGGGVRRTYPSVNVWSDENTAIVSAELPGVNAQELELTVMGSDLTVKGRKTATEFPAETVWHKRERGSGEFVRTIPLPFEVENEGLEAELKNGVLTVSLRKAPESRPKKVSIRAS